jgi:D-tyrosyl-tRNA(Tyr) deacylase
MKLVLQRVLEARVLVHDITVGAIGPGIVAFLGIGRTDTTEDADYLLDKLLHLRIFPDENHKMNLDVGQKRGSLLIVSQFTLYGDCRRGRRPNFDQAAPPREAEALYNHFVEAARGNPVPVQTGVFQAMMEVHLTNDGPVTILMDSADRRKP